MLTREMIDEEILDYQSRGIDPYYMDSRDAESPKMVYPRCSNCGAVVKDSVDEIENNELEFRMVCQDGYCPSCGYYVSFQHEWALEDFTTMKCHDLQALPEEEMYWREDGNYVKHGLYLRKSRKASKPVFPIFRRKKDGRR